MGTTRLLVWLSQSTKTCVTANVSTRLPTADLTEPQALCRRRRRTEDENSYFVMGLAYKNKTKPRWPTGFPAPREAIFFWPQALWLAPVLLLPSSNFFPQPPLGVIPPHETPCLSSFVRKTWHLFLRPIAPIGPGLSAGPLAIGSGLSGPW